MDLGFTGKSALITGASKGIGAAVARVLAAEGCELHLAARSEQGLAALREAIVDEHGIAVSLHPMDLADSAAQAKLAEACSGVDILVNNAGAIPGGPIDAVDEARWREAWELKVFGYVNLCRAFYAPMKARGSGVILNVVGLAGEHPIFEYVAGTTGNAALMGLTRALGGKSVEDGIRVLAVNPGLVSTERMVTMLEGRAESALGDRSRWQELAQTLPMGRPATPEEVADLCAFLVSPRASYLSGIVVPIDGGKSARGSLF